MAAGNLVRSAPPWLAARCAVLEGSSAICYKPLDLNRKKYITMMRSRLLPALAACLVAASLIASPPLRADDLADISALHRQGDHALALERVDAYLAAKPGNVEARFLKGLILTDQKNYPEATRVFVALMEEKPELPEPYNNLAVVYAAQGKYNMAKVQLENAISANPGYATAYENLGDVYARMASEAYGKALALDPSRAGTRGKLSLMQELFAKTGNPASPPAAAPEASTGQ